MPSPAARNPIKSAKIDNIELEGHLLAPDGFLLSRISLKLRQQRPLNPQASIRLAGQHNFEAKPVFNDCR